MINLLDENMNRYKANLHCHTDISDGKLTPEAVKKAYMENGYSVIAYTDHDVLIGHSDLNEKNFLALNGYEIEIKETKYEDSKNNKTCHICMIQKNPDNLKQVCFHREKYFIGNGANYKKQIQFDETLPDYEREYTPECINDIMKQGRENGFFVTYNHPAWSQERYPEYIKYEGMNAMEIVNYGCITEGYDEYNASVYDDILIDGKKIYCIAGDDNHNIFEFGHPQCDSFGGFTVIFAKELTYEAIMDALFKGNFYASRGPEIYSCYYDGNIHIKCSDAQSIVLSTGRRRRQVLFAENGKSVNEAEFKVLKEDLYVRITVTDKYGKTANTNAYFAEDLIAELNK